MHALQLEHMTKRLGGRLVIDRLNLSLETGDCCGLLGVNGAGKSTTFRLISGTLRPDAGHIHHSGRLALLPQDCRMPPGRTVKDILNFLARLSGVPWRQCRAAVDAVLEKVDLGPQRQTRSERLSHGQHKRLMLAQALLGNPQTLLLDEPLEGLDPRSAAAMRALLAEYAQHCTLLISSHNLDEISRLCRSVAILHQGCVHYHGTVQTLLEDSRVEYELGAPDDAFDPATLPPIQGVHDTMWQPPILTLRYDPTDVALEALNQQIVPWLLESGLALRAIKPGRTLEEGFLARLREADCGTMK